MKPFWQSILQWFDSSVESEKSPSKSSSEDIDWIRSIPFLSLHVVCLAVIFVGWSWIAVGVAVALYFIRMFAITAFYHRYFCHRAFKTSRFGQFLFAAAGCAAVQKGPLWWAAHHRHHHRNSDQETDVHSPHTSGMFWSHMGWILSKENFPTNLKAVPDLAKFPELRFLDRFDLIEPFLLAISVFSLGSYLEWAAPHLGTSGPQMLVWGFIISTVVLFHGTSTINSLTHKFGTKRYRTSDESRNSFILALITLGEGWHNNHHYFPASARQGFFWWEIDVSYYLLYLLSKTGLVWELRPIPEAARQGGRL